MHRNELREKLVERFPRERQNLLPALHYVQKEFGHVDETALEVIGWHLGVPASEVYGTATSYTEIRLQKLGPKVVSVCTGLSCWINGGQQILENLSVVSKTARRSRSKPDIQLEEVPCGFMCALSPVVEVEGAWIGRVDPDRIVRVVMRDQLTQTES